MNRIDRLFGVLLTIQSGKLVTAETLSQKFEISVRTVFRDIKALNELGIPLGFEPGKGYFVVQGYFLPPLSFTSDEANAMVLLASLSERFCGESTAKSIANAVTKIKAVLKYTEKEKANNLTENISVYLPNELKGSYSQLEMVQNAILNKEVLEIEYTNNLQEHSKREIEPIGLAFYTLQWHVIAWCWNRNAYRDFKIRMISNLKRTSQKFRKTDHITLENYISTLKQNNTGTLT